MLRRFATLLSLKKVVSSPRSVGFSTRVPLFQKSPEEIVNIKSDSQPIDANLLTVDSTLSPEDNIEAETVSLKKDTEVSEKLNKEYDPDWYIHNDEDDLPLPTKEVQGFTPRWLKSSLENTDDKYHDSKLTPSELSKDLFEKFFVEQRASDYLYIDVSGNCEWASAMVIVQGQSLRHLQAMSDSTRRFIKACQPFDTSIPNVLSLEGEMDDEWIVLDAGKTILHFMTAGAREKYKIEDIWSDLRDSNLEILQKISSASDVEAKKELLLKLQENMTNSWEQDVESDPLFDSEEDMKSHLEK